MKNLILIVNIVFIFMSVLKAQDDLVNSDYLTFGRKEPASLGTVFSALTNEPIFLNPASVALITDNRITIGGSISDLGTSYMLSWTAPNFSISSARHTATLRDSVYSEYQKELLKFSFAVSNTDINWAISNLYLSAGFAVKTLSDRLSGGTEEKFGGDALSYDLGVHLFWRYLSFELAMLNVNAPNLAETDLRYARAVSIVGRYHSPSGFVLAIQGINSSTYAGSDLGIHLAAEQSFWDNRLISRVQLTSFFKGTRATMQNISGSIGYRPMVRSELMNLQDIEFNYTLSFLAMPQTVGTHMIVLTKYF